MTPLGQDEATVWSNLVEGVSGAGPITLCETSNLATRFAAEVKEFDPENFMSRKTARNIGRVSQFGVAATEMALQDADLRISDMDPDDVGVIVASGFGGIEEMQTAQHLLEQRGYMRVSPFSAPMIGINMTSALVALQTGALGVNFCLVSACASGSHAIGEAAEVIRRGDAKVMLAGGAEAPITPLTIAMFNRIHATSERNQEPERASRPWDVERDGFVWGEGSVIFVLEDWDHAVARGARIRAELAGYGNSIDAYHYTAPEPEGQGAARSMRKAIKKAGVEPEDVGYVNAHGTSTKIGDVAETKALRLVFGEHAPRVPVSSTKSMHAHMIGAAGSMEAAVCVLALEHGMIPPTINLERQDEECDLDYVPLVARPANLDVALSNSMGFGGHNATLVLRKAAAVAS
jgi:3-oxoacyl-[acyl-carrier-protein] synthase II